MYIYINIYVLHDKNTSIYIIYLYAYYNNINVLY